MRQNFEIEHARSKSNGIVFYSNLDPLIGYETFLDEKGEIQNHITCSTTEDYILYQDSIALRKKIFCKKWVAIAFLLLLVSFSTVISICLKTPSPLISALYFSGFASFEIFRMINSSYAFKIKDKNNCSVAKFHSAEHMAINAYKELERIPTLEEIKKFSRFSKNCGSMKSLNRISFFTLFSIILLTWTESFFFILAICYMILVVLALKYSWFRFLQIFFTSKPTDKELIVAIEGLKFYEEMEEFKQKISALRKSSETQTP